MTRLRARRPGFDSPQWQETFSTSSRPNFGSSQSPIRRVPWGLSPGIKRQGLEAGHSPQSNAEIMKECGLVIRKKFMIEEFGDILRFLVFLFSFGFVQCALTLTN